MKTDSEATNTLTFPNEAIVGSLGSLARELANARRSRKNSFFACALTVVGAMCSRDLTINLGIEVDPRLYTVLLGSSYDVKKSTAMKKTVQFFETLGSNRMPRIVYGVGSAEGLARYLSEHGKVLLAYEELRVFVDKTKVQSSVLLPLTASLYEQHRWENATKHGEHDLLIDDGHLSILGCCTTDTYEQMWTSGAVAIGFPNRLFVVGADRKPKVAWPQLPDEGRLSMIRSELMQQLSKLPLRLEITGEAKRLWEDLYHALPSGEHEKRLDTLGFRLLALIALTTNKTAIDSETVATVRLILDYELKMRELTDPIDADTLIATLEEKIRRVLARKGRMTKRDLKKAVNAHRTGLWAFDQAVRNLLNQNEIPASWNPCRHFCRHPSRRAQVPPCHEVAPNRPNEYIDIYLIFKDSLTIAQICFAAIGMAGSHMLTAIVTTLRWPPVSPLIADMTWHLSPRCGV